MTTNDPSSILLDAAAPLIEPRWLHKRLPDVVKGGVDAVAFSTDGNTLATGGVADHHVLLWDVSAFRGN